MSKVYGSGNAINTALGLWRSAVGHTGHTVLERFVFGVGGLADDRQPQAEGCRWQR